jgi:Protein of unknown function (DUF1588)/Protein of unknown function (DUF1592)/Protein of unknown function (DUF1585)/Planctomycete cytochrome C
MEVRRKSDRALCCDHVAASPHLVVLCLLFSSVFSAERADERDVTAFLDQQCAKCHTGPKAKGDFKLTQLDANAITATSAPLWVEVGMQIKLGEMPPESRPRPDAKATARMLAWLSGALRRAGVDTTKLDEEVTGNRVDHALLFTAPITEPLNNPPRLWRLSPQMYLSSLNAYNPGNNPLTQPMSTGDAHGFLDLADKHSIDAGTLSTLIRNASRIANQLTAHHLEEGLVVMDQGSSKGFAALLNPQMAPERKEFTRFLSYLFGHLRSDIPDQDGFASLYALYLKTRNELGAGPATRAVIVALLLQPEALFRLELGRGPVDALGRHRLSSQEIAIAVNSALCDRPMEPNQRERASKGALDTREGVAAEVRQMVSRPLKDNPRILRFFREYFEYGSAPDVFKDKALNPNFLASALVGDTDQLIQVILMRDRDVLKELLTTRESFIGSRWNLEKNTGGPVYPNTKNHLTYNLPDWPAGMQPITLPAEQRCGILTQPSWLVARSQNFNNDAIRRGKWIREHLLGQMLPDVPITVCAMLPADRSKTLRERMQVTTAEACWSCHQRMNPLGLAFEQFDHFGRYRTSETVDDPSTPMIPGRDPKRDPPTTATREVPLDTTGEIRLTGDPELDGPVANAHELIQRLAASTRVRQVFVRHAFRYWMGRMENLGDAPSLREADQAYVASGGSMKALIVALLSSDSFLYRTIPATP